VDLELFLDEFEVPECELGLRFLHSRHHCDGPEEAKGDQRRHRVGGAGVSGMTASHGRRQRFDCEVHAPDDDEEIVWRGVGTRKRLSATRCGPGPPRGSQASPRLAAFVPLSFSKDERFRGSSAHGADAHARVTVTHLPVSLIPRCLSIEADTRRPASAMPTIPNCRPPPCT
jgi:hypothetical protein